MKQNDIEPVVSNAMTGQIVKKMRSFNVCHTMKLRKSAYSSLQFIRVSKTGGTFLQRNI